MDAKNIIPQGERAKFFVKSMKNNFNFSFEDSNYYLEIIYGMQGRKIVIPKSEFIYSSNKRWFFSFPTDDIVGPVKARLVMDIVDTDCPDNLRVEVDEQYIAFVITNPCPQFFKCPKCCGKDRDIIYERTESSDVAQRYAVLADKDGARFVTDDDCYLIVDVSQIYAVLADKDGVRFMTDEGEYLCVLRIF